MTKMPHPEVEYFGKKDVVKKRKLAEEKKSQLAKEELEKLKQLHQNRCGECGFEFEEISFKGLRILKCFNCGGVFIEEKIFEQLCGKEGQILEGLLSLFRYEE